MAAAAALCFSLLFLSFLSGALICAVFDSRNQLNLNESLLNFLLSTSDLCFRRRFAGGEWRGNSNSRRIADQSMNRIRLKTELILIFPPPCDMKFAEDVVRREAVVG